MNTTVIIGICVCIIICLLAMLAAVIAACRLREKKLLRRLQEMLEDAVAGTFSEGKLMDTGISELESAMWRFLNDSQLSSVQLAEQKQRIQSLISDISHQTVTPIANIKIYAELLGEQQEKWKAGDSSVKEDIAEEIEAVIDQVDKLDFLIGSLVKLSRLENGILELEPKRCCIWEVLSAINRQFQPKAQQKGITLVIDDSGEEAEFDLKWTIEAVGNIVDNAIKYTSKGGTVSLHVVLYSMFLRLDVADTGIGIAEQEQASVFTRFYRSRKAAEQPGVGIGLYFAREVLRRERGYIKVSSEPDKGSVFSVFLSRG